MTREYPHVAFVTIGETPRNDVLPGLLQRIGKPVTVTEFGVLDGLGETDIRAMAPGLGDIPLAAFRHDNLPAIISTEACEKRIRGICSSLDTQHFDVIVLMSTGLYLSARTITPLINAQRVVDAWLDSLVHAQQTIGL
ncbi:MAG: AroM family protein, partial [Geminicoccaceae bacterium]